MVFALQKLIIKHAVGVGERIVFIYGKKLLLQGLTNRLEYSEVLDQASGLIKRSEFAP